MWVIIWILKVPIKWRISKLNHKHISNIWVIVQKWAALPMFLCICSCVLLVFEVTQRSAIKQLILRQMVGISLLICRKTTRSFKITADFHVDAQIWTKIIKSQIDWQPGLLGTRFWWVRGVNLNYRWLLQTPTPKQYYDTVWRDGVCSARLTCLLLY